MATAADLFPNSQVPLKHITMKVSELCCVSYSESLCRADAPRPPNARREGDLMT